MEDLESVVLVVAGVPQPKYIFSEQSTKLVEHPVSQAAVVQGRTQQDSNKLLVQLVQQQALVSAQVRDQQIMHFEQQVGQAQGFGTAGAYVGDPVAEAKGFRW